MIERFNLIDTYTKKGMTEDQIIDDAIYTTMKNLRGYTDKERELRGINDDFLDGNNLRRMYEDKQLKFLWNEKGGTKDPVYSIYIDVDGDGEWQQLSNVQDRDAMFRPEKLGNKYNNLAYKKVFEDVIGKMADDFLSKKGEALREKGSKDSINTIDDAYSMYDYLPSSMDDAKDLYVRSFGIDPKENPEVSSLLSYMTRVSLGLFYNSGQEGIKNIEQVFNSIPFLPNVNFDVNALRDIQQSRMLDTLAIEEVKKQIGGELPSSIMSQVEVKFDESHIPQMMSNPFAEGILKHEGYSDTVYNAKDPNFNSKKINVDVSGIRGIGQQSDRRAYVDGSNISLAQYESLQAEGSDPTIGSGINLKDQVNVDILTSIKNADGSQKYTLEGLMNGTQKLDRVDNFYVFYKRVSEKLEIADNKTKAYDLTANKNILLAAAITNLEFLGGGFNGKRFYTALNNYARTGDDKYIGSFGPYKEGDEPSIGQELYTDASNAKTASGVRLGGYMNRFSDVYDLIKAWSLGSFDVMPQYVMNPEVLNPSIG